MTEGHFEIEELRDVAEFPLTEMRRLFATSRRTIAVFDDRWTCLAASPTWSELCGGPFGAPVGAPSRWHEAVERALAGAHVLYEDVVHDGGACDGTVLRWEMVPLRVSDSDRPSAAVVAEDATGQRHAELAERRLVRLAQVMADALVVIDAHLRIAEANPAAHALVGVAGGSLVGRGVEALLPPGNGTAARSMIERCLAGDDLRSVETVLRGPGERPVPVLLTLTAVPDPDRAVVEVVLVAKDLRERERSREVLESLRRELHQRERLDALGLLAGGIAHDFNNQLTVIDGSVELLSAQIDQAAPVLRHLDRIRAAVRRGADLTHQLLQFARQGSAELDDFDLNDVVREAAGLLGPLLGRDLRLELDLSPDALPVRADPTQILQVVVNLVLNARDASPDGATVRLGTRRSPDPTAVLVEVSDEGSGMEPEAESRAFEPFFTTKPTGEGNGLGLSTSYGIIERFGGSIRLRTRPGLGTTVTVRLPLRPVPTEDQRD